MPTLHTSRSLMFSILVPRKFAKLSVKILNNTCVCDRSVNFFHEHSTLSDRAPTMLYAVSLHHDLLCHFIGYTYTFLTPVHLNLKHGSTVSVTKKHFFAVDIVVFCNINIV